MTYLSHLSGMGGRSLKQVLVDELAPRDVEALGIASAFVSVSGVRELLAITRRRHSLTCRLVAGVSHAITHPQALMEAMDAGWEVRFGSAAGKAIFHPKMILSGRSFLGNGGVRALAFAYVGSSNLTKGGLQTNVECGVIARTDSAPPSFAPCFASLWNAGRRATVQAVETYAKEFARRNRERRVDDLEALGIADGAEDEPTTYDDIARQPRNARGAIMPQSAAEAAWAGLESFTGEYRFQVEFPQAAGQILSRVIRHSSGRSVPVLCTEDGVIREMSYRFYTHNGMFRLNIPNDTPGVELARQNRSGIALVEESNSRNVAALLTIVLSGSRLDEIVRRSLLLGTWGRTQTRAYGWY